MEPYEIEEAVVVDEALPIEPEPTESDLAEIEALEPAADERPLTVAEWLDREDLDRLEWERVEQDLYPGAVPDAGQVGHIHRETDAVQGWLAEMRRL